MKKLKTKRLSHGERTRLDILETAVMLGASEGLEALTIGRLAEAMGMSKGGVFAHFGSKEALQLATVDAAHSQFLEEVAGPASRQPAGVAQLRAFLDGYFAYLERRHDRGGCFFTAAALEYDDRPGSVRTKLRRVLRRRDGLVAAAIEQAKKVGQLDKKADSAQVAFEVIAVATGANVAYQLMQQSDALERARAALEAKLAALSR